MEKIKTFWDLAFETVKEITDEKGNRYIDYADVEKLIIEMSRDLHEDSENPGNFVYVKPRVTRRTRSDKGTKRMSKDESVSGPKDNGVPLQNVGELQAT